jgi:hypothetical protein
MSKTNDFPWGESGDLFWEARDAGWGNEINLAYELGRRDGLEQAAQLCDQILAPKTSPKGLAEAMRLAAGEAEEVCRGLPGIDRDHAA